MSTPRMVLLGSPEYFEIATATTKATIVPNGKRLGTTEWCEVSANGNTNMYEHTLMLVSGVLAEGSAIGVENVLPSSFDDDRAAMYVNVRVMQRKKTGFVPNPQILPKLHGVPVESFQSSTETQTVRLLPALYGISRSRATTQREMAKR